MSTMNVLKFVDVSKSYDGYVAVSNFSATISEGEIVALLGRSSQ